LAGIIFSKALSAALKTFLFFNAEVRFIGILSQYIPPIISQVKLFSLFKEGFKGA